MLFTHFLIEIHTTRVPLNPLRQQRDVTTFWTSATPKFVHLDSAGYIYIGKKTNNSIEINCNKIVFSKVFFIVFSLHSLCSIGFWFLSTAYFVRTKLTIIYKASKKFLHWSKQCIEYCLAYTYINSFIIKQWRKLGQLGDQLFNSVPSSVEKTFINKLILHRAKNCYTKNKFITHISIWLF